jgi:4-alpha-glucanotransferase
MADRTTSPPRELVRSALSLLGKDDLWLIVHDASFPGEEGEDLGRGSPYSAAATRFFELLVELGFDGVQLGPQGLTSDDNPSPYDGTLFSRNPLSIALGELASADGVLGGLLRPETLTRLSASRPSSATFRVPYAHVVRATRSALDEAFSAFELRRARSWDADPLVARLDRFRDGNDAWLAPDGLYAPLCALHGTADFSGIPPEHVDRRLYDPLPGQEGAAALRSSELRRLFARELERHAFAQLLVATQHEAFRGRMKGLGLELSGDLQIGISRADTFRHGASFLRGYLLGAPPSRTNPEGQPWGYPVLDPGQYEDGRGDLGPSLLLLRARVDKLLSEFDRIRLDHPHGLVCPWVYRGDDPDPLHAVQHGARLFDSPDLPDHPELARFAIARPEQRSRVVRHADDWVTSLDDAQIARYARAVDVVVRCLAERGRTPAQLSCEVLSTRPHPLARVMERYGLGRFRVTQKASLDDPQDVYRSHNAAPEDWIMVGNHDTPPLALLVSKWHYDGTVEARARYLAERLVPEGGDVEALAGTFLRDRGALADAYFADLFASPARHVMIFFADLFGMEEIYNLPGIVSQSNWSLRIPQDFERAYRSAVEEGRAPSLPRALALALSSRAKGLGTAGEELARALLPR